MPRCPVCDALYPEGDRFCEQDGAALKEDALPPAIGVGTMIGTYRLERKIGEGGMGVVYEAIHPIIERRIAIKLIHPSRAQDAEVIWRFFDEARALARSRHPNIVEVYDLGQLPDGTVFLEMELLQGRSLRARFLEGPLDPDEIRWIFTRAAAGLSAAHAAGVIHRDLKPENIFLCEDGQVKLLDFGVVKLLDREDETPGWTKPGTLVGTPEYMAPEQILGEKRIDQRSDIYSFGLLLYEALAGGLPFDPSSLLDVLARQVQEVFPPPSALVGRPLDPALEAVIQKCLEKKPEARFRTMAEVLAALQDFSRPPTAALASVSLMNFPSLSFSDQPTFGNSPGGFSDRGDEDLTPGDLRRGAPLQKMLRVRGKLWRRVDALNMGDVAAEEAHALSSEGPLERVRLSGFFPSGRYLVNEGISHNAPLSFRFSGLVPRKSAFLLFRVDVGAGQEQEVDTFVDGALLHTRPLQEDRQYRWRHETVLLPEEVVQQSSITVTRAPRGARGTNLYAAWLYQESESP